MCSNVVECAGSNVPLCTTHKLITSCILLMPYIPAKNFAALVIAVVVFAFWSLLSAIKRDACFPPHHLSFIT